MQAKDSWESARQACLKQVFGGPLNSEEGEQLHRFLATEEGRGYLRQSEEMRHQLKEVVEIRQKPVNAAEMTRRFEGMVREKIRKTLHMSWLGTLGFGSLFAVGLVAVLQGGGWTYRGWFLSASAALFGYALLVLRKKNQKMLVDSDLTATMRRDQDLARKLRTKINGCLFYGIVVFGWMGCAHLDGKPATFSDIWIMLVSLTATPLALWWSRRKDRELWDWWEEKATS